MPVSHGGSCQLLFSPEHLDRAAQRPLNKAHSGCCLQVGWEGLGVGGLRGKFVEGNLSPVGRDPLLCTGGPPWGVAPSQHGDRLLPQPGEVSHPCGHRRQGRCWALCSTKDQVPLQLPCWEHAGNQLTHSSPPPPGSVAGVLPHPTQAANAAGTSSSPLQEPGGRGRHSGHSTHCRAGTLASPQIRTEQNSTLAFAHHQPPSFPLLAAGRRRRHLRGHTGGPPAACPPSTVLLLHRNLFKPHPPATPPQYLKRTPSGRWASAPPPASLKPHPAQAKDRELGMDFTER